MKQHPRRLTLAWLSAAALFVVSPAQAGGVLEVTFVQPEKFTDFGKNAFETERVQREMQDHLRQMAERYLPDGRTLKLDILDVDRVGSLGPTGRSANLDRRVDSPLDWPRIHLRYELREGDRVVAQGDDWLKDQDFLRRLSFTPTDELSAEKAMLRRWFAARVANGAGQD